METIVEYIGKGGIFMYPILLGTLWALTLLFERLLFIAMTCSHMKKDRTSFFNLLTQDNDKAHRHLMSKKGFINKIFSIAMAHRDKPVDRIEEKIDLFLLSELPLLSKRLNLLGSLAGLMPILGLLGTVTGMITTFKVIALQGTGDAQAMADGISEALITTQAGLVAAIPIILGHVLLTTRVKEIIDATHETCTALLDIFKDLHAEKNL